MKFGRFANGILNTKRKQVVYLLSFPKCGRTWLRLMLGAVLQEHYGVSGSDPMDLEQISGLIEGMSKIVVTHDGFPQGQLPEELPKSKAKYVPHKVIFLVRDPRDVITSLYFQRKYREQLSPSAEIDTTIPSDLSISDFLRVRQGGLETIIAYYNIWDRVRDVVSDFILVKYEDLHTNAFREIHRILQFLEINDVADELICRKVEFCSFENMRTMEETNALDSFRLKPANPNQPNSFKTRKGKVGGYREFFTDTDIQYMDRLINEELSSTFGY